MTEDQRNALLAELRRQREIFANSKEESRSVLIELGIYTPEGQLTPEFGGVSTKID